MTTMSKSDIKELKDLINSRFDELQQEINGVKQDISEVKQDVNKVDKRLTIMESRLEEWKPSINKISDLAEKVGEFKNWKQLSIIFITGFVSSAFSATIGGLVGWLIRSGKP